MSTSDVIKLPTLIEWAQLKEWAADLRDKKKLKSAVKTDVNALHSILDTYYKFRRRNKTLAKELWETAKQLEVKILKRLPPED